MHSFKVTGARLTPFIPILEISEPTKRPGLSFYTNITAPVSSSPWSLADIAKISAFFEFVTQSLCPDKIHFSLFFYKIVPSVQTVFPFFSLFAWAATNSPEANFAR
jgi:hypothetical protein